MKVQFAPIAFLLALMALSAPAQATDDPTAEEIFELLCARKIPATATSDDRKLRGEFQSFLRSPRLTARALDRSLKADSKDVGSAIDELFLYSSTCHFADTYAKELQQKGCFTTKGKKISPDLAIQLCKPLAAKFSAASNKPAPLPVDG